MGMKEVVAVRFSSQGVRVSSFTSKVLASRAFTPTSSAAHSLRLKAWPFLMIHRSEAQRDSGARAWSQENSKS